MNGQTCNNCGGDYSIHHYQTMQCPVGGRESPVGRPQEWKSTTFEAIPDYDTAARWSNADLRAERERAAAIEQAARNFVGIWTNPDMTDQNVFRALESLRAAARSLGSRLAHMGGAHPARAK